MKWKFYVLVMAAVLAGASASAQGSRSIIKQQIDEWGSCRSAALTLTGGDLVLNGFNDYACPDVPENLAVTLSQLRARGDYLDDVQLTEEGRWLILYGDNGVLWNDIPQELEQTLREYNEAQEIITSVAFNDAGDWIVVSKSRYAASSPSLTRWIAEGIDEYGALWTAHMTEDGTVLCFENGYLWRGNVPGIVQQKLRETTLDAYRVKFLSDGTYFIADQEGQCEYYL